MAPRWAGRGDAPLYGGVVAGIVALLVALATGAWAGRISDSAIRTDADTQAVVSAAGRVREHVVDAQTAQRGYLLTGRRGYLASYEAADGQIPSALVRLQQATADDPDRAARVATLAAAVAAVRTELAASVSSAASVGPNQLPEEGNLETDAARQLGERIREITTDLQQSAEQDATRERQRAGQAYRILRTVGTVTGALALVLLAGMLGLLVQRGRMARERRESDRARELLAARLRDLSTRDALTGLPNRELLRDRLSRALLRAERDGTPLAVLFVSLTGLRAVNAAHGHLAGDAVIVQATERLQAALRPEDTLARWGGNELVAVCERVPAGAATEQVAAALHSGLGRGPFHVGADTVTVTAAVGTAVAQDGAVVGATGLLATAESLVAAADTAMQQAKETGRSSTYAFDETTARRRTERQQLVSDLDGATAGGELWVAYQPLVHLDTRELIGAEALVRWRHPRHGQLAPDDFVPLAEEAGLIEDIGTEVLLRACAQAARWNRRRRDLGLTPLKISVNVSARQLLDPCFAARTLATLSTTTLRPQDLTLELTESALVESSEHANLTQLTDAGVTLALDDFGTGYSSLAYLRQLPIDLIKIDRSFTSGMSKSPEDRAIVRTIVGLAHNLERSVLAEGVETPEQERQLLDLGCELGQGYFYGRPAAAAELSAAVGGAPLT